MSLMMDNQAMINMKIFIKKSLFVLCLVLVAFMYSCSKSSTTVEPDNNSKVKITACSRFFNTDQPYHIIKIKFAIQNSSQLKLHYCKVRLSFYDEHNVVYSDIFVIGSKNNHDWTLLPNDVRWSEYYDTDFYVFGDGSYHAEIIETLFY